MKINTKYNLLIFIFIFIPYIGFAQSHDNSSLPADSELFRIIPKIGFSYDYHLLNFNGFLGSVDCGHFDNGFGWSIPLSVSLEKYWDKDIYTEFQIGFTFNKSYLTQNLKFPVRDSSTGNVIEVHSQNRLLANFGVIELSPGIGYNILQNQNFTSRIVGNLRFAIPIIKDFEQKEVIMEPETAVFQNINDSQTKERPLASGTIQTASNPFIILGLGLEAMTKKLGTYKISINYTLNNITSDTDWKIFALRFELGYPIIFKEKKKIPKKDIEIRHVEIEKIPTEVNTSPVIFPTRDPIVYIQNVQLEGVIEVGSELLASLPIVNNVFFDTNSANIAELYKEKNVPENVFIGDALKIHRFLLPRIAAIIKDNPKSEIILQSSTSGNENEPEGKELSKKRALTVQNTLLSLGVPKNKIKLLNLVSPQNPSNQEFEEGILENQRVEIILKDAPLQEYIDIQKYSNLKGKITFDAMILDINGDSVKIQNNLSDSIFYLHKTGNYNIPIDNRLNQFDTTLNFKISYYYANKEEIHFEQFDMKKISRKNVDLNLSNFQAILRFDYNSSKLSNENKDLIKQMAEKLPSGVTLEILGNADELGSVSRNEELAKERASNTLNFINSIAKEKFKFTIVTNQMKFPENTPQGRFLNRSIRIRIIH